MAVLKSELAEVTKLCTEEHKLTEEDIKKIKDRAFPENGAPENVKCYLRCFALKSKLANDDGVDINRFVLVSELYGKDKETATAIIEKCKGVYKAPHDCQNAWDMYQCNA